MLFNYGCLPFLPIPPPQSMLYYVGDSWHTQNIQINKVIGNNGKCVFILQKKTIGTFGQRNICIFWTFYINGIIQYVLLWTGSFTWHNILEIYHVATCCGTSFLLVAEYFIGMCIPLFVYSIYQMTNIWAVYIFWLLWVMLLSIFDKFLCGDMVFNSLGYVLMGGIAGSLGISIFDFFI